MIPPTNNWTNRTSFLCENRNGYVYTINDIHLCKGTVPQLCSLNVPVNDLCIHCIFIKDIKKYVHWIA